MLKTITKEEFQSFFESLFFTEAKRIDIRYNAKAHKEQEEACEFKSGGVAEKRHESLTAFKEALGVYPDQISTNFV